MLHVSSLVHTMASFIDDIPGVYVPQEDLETTITELALNTVLIAAGALAVLTVIALLFSQKYEKLKMPLFVLMTIAMAGSTVSLIGSTVYLNTKADSGGPVHWHADIEFWACGNELEVRDPRGAVSNKIGTPTLHEHNDHRIHLEGVVVDDVIDASLGKYMHVIGGAITAEQVVIPLNDESEGSIFEDEVDGDGPTDSNADAINDYIINDVELDRVASFRDGDTCDGQKSDVQVFIYTYDSDTKTYEQHKEENPRDYVITDDPNVPPGDCIIVEFGPEREKTDRLCEQYGIRDIARCPQFGVEPKQRAICEIEQVNFDSSQTVPAEQQETTTGELQGEEIDDSGDDTEFETTENIEGAVHINPVTEDQRIACEATNDNTSKECTTYQTTLDSDPGATDEAEAAKNAANTTSDEDTTEGGTS